MKSLFVSSRVESRIASLEKAGKAGKALAQKVTGIIDDLASGGTRRHMDRAASYTKHGENRIDHCRKYDLGCGYRLIMLQRGERVFIPFLGSHDECQRWLADNSGQKSLRTGKGTTLPVQGSPFMADSKTDAMDGEMDDDLLPPLTDKELRLVFRGLIDRVEKGSGRQPESAATAPLPGSGTGGSQ
jgi:hypothetical protein